MNDASTSEKIDGNQEVGLREQTKVRNRAEIMSAARKVFLEMGYGAASVSDIVRNTNLSQGTFYNYFPDKETVFREIVDEAADQVRDALLTSRADAENPLEFVRAGFRMAFEATLQDGTLNGILRRNFPELTSRDAELYESVPSGGVIREMMDDLGNQIRERVDGGEMPSFDVEYMVNAMAAVVVQIGHDMMEREPPDIEGATDFVTALFAGCMMFLMMQQQGNDDASAT